MKKFLKSVKNWQNHDHESVAPFLAHPVVCFVCCLHLSLHSESKIYLCNNFVRAMPIFRILSLLSSGIIYAHYSWIDSHDTSAMLSPLFFLYIWPVTVNLAFQKWICNEVQNNICSCCVNTLQIHKKNYKNLLMYDDLMQAALNAFFRYIMYCCIAGKCFMSLKTYCVCLTLPASYLLAHSKLSTMTHWRKFHVFFWKLLLMSTKRTMYGNTAFVYQ